VFHVKHLDFRTFNFINFLTKTFHVKHINKNFKIKSLKID
jgi:hypothetical protein